MGKKSWIKIKCTENTKNEGPCFRIYRNEKIHYDCQVMKKSLGHLKQPKMARLNFLADEA